MNELDDFLTGTGLVAANLGRQWTPLTGGISSDIWRVDLSDGRSLCVKRALPQLKVAVDWQAPVSRSAYEWAWLRFAAGVVSHAVPAPLACDEGAGLLAMEFLPPHDHPVWKQQLLEGRVEPATAAAVGDTVGALHAASAHRADLARAFDTGASFHAIRLEPYLLATARRHPALAPELEALVKHTAATRIALVHGDVSPKNILVGPKGPVILDAECAWYGDPAFDLAFCLNHLLLKCLWVPQAKSAFLNCFAALRGGYLERMSYEDPKSLEARTAALLPALLLARVDGKSPVEYLTDGKDLVRRVARALLAQPPATLGEIQKAWQESSR